jgi:small GTP-binding protein
MGLLLTTLNKLYWRFSEPRMILVCGLDNAGKTSLVNHLRGVKLPTVPTMGFNADMVDLGFAKFSMFDMCGQDTRRPMWSMFFRHAHALVYVVDSDDVSRLYESGQEFLKIRTHENFPDIPLLVLANKQDATRASTPAQVMRAMRLKDERRPWHVCGTSLRDGDGVDAGLEWLTLQL